MRILCTTPKPFGSAEYQKDYKPQNNYGCGCNYTPEPPAKTIKRGCYIRYKIS